MEDKASCAMQQSKVSEHIITCLVFIALAFLAVMAIIGTTCNIHSFDKESIALTGKLEKINPYYHGSIVLSVKGGSYKLSKDNQFSKRSFGVVNNLPLNDLKNALYGEIGKNVYLEWIQVGSKKIIVQLSVDGTDYVDKDVAVHDFIKSERTVRTIWIVVLVIAIVLLWLAQKNIIR